MKELRGRIAALTGAGSGIGQATAVALAARGCTLALADIDTEGLAATRRLVEEAGSTASVHTVDVSQRDQVLGFADEVRSAHGGCHIVVNNAGVTSAGRFEAETLDDIEWLVGINVFGVVHGCHAFLPLLREAEEGHIVNLSSMVSFVGLPQNSVYSLSKGAVRSFTEGLRGELAGTPIGVTAVFPGAIRTNIMHAARGPEAERLSKMARNRLAPYLLRPPKAVAQKIVTSIERDRARALVGPDARMLDITARLIPGRTGLVGRALDRVSG